MPGNGKKPIDALVVLTKATLGDRRRSPARILITGLLFVLLLAVPIYLLWPGPDAPLLMLAAYDQVALPGERIAVSARVEPMGENRTNAKLNRHEVYFQELLTDWREQRATDRAGLATVERTFSPADTTFEIMARYPGDGRRQQGTQAKARVFVWAAQTSLLVVDADRSLVSGQAPPLWDAPNLLDVRPEPGAVVCLRQARAKYRIAYLSSRAERPLHYNKLRAWLERGWAPEPEQFPDGPVLAPADPSRSKPSEFSQAILGDLKQRFQGTMVAITADEENARLFHAAGWQTLLLRGADNLPQGIIGLGSWSELDRRLPRPAP